MSEASRVVKDAERQLKKKFTSLKDKTAILRSPELRKLYTQVKSLPLNQRAGFGREVNELKAQLGSWVEEWEMKAGKTKIGSLDLTAPYAPNTPTSRKPSLFTADSGSKHPITAEIEEIGQIFSDMGFDIEESRTLYD